MKADARLAIALEQAVDAYLETYFRARDATATFKHLTNAMTGFGTAEDEDGYDYEASCRFYRRDFEQAPDPVDYEVLYRKSKVLTPGVGLVVLKLNLRTVIKKQTLRLKNVRVSMVFLLENERWLLEHQHVSLPTTAHGPHEAYPVKELEDRAAVLKRLVEERTRDLEHARQQLERRATTDLLTGLYNRAKGDDLLRIETARAARTGRPYAVMLLDIDHFKLINDTRGHQVGDRVLTSFGNLLASSARETDIIARWGGEEFLVICPATSRDEAIHLAERLRGQLRQQEFAPELTVTTSVGVAQYSPGDTRVSLLARADTALYRAKESGRDRVASG